MNKNELMIGDWVMFDQSPYQIKGIFAREGNLVPLSSTDYRIYAEGKFIYGFAIEHCSPIPLAEDILKANKLYQVQPNLYELPHLGKYRLFVGIGNDTLVPNSLGVTIYVQYVHEFQHALRLCKLDELADKFKIK